MNGPSPSLIQVVLGLVESADSLLQLLCVAAVGIHCLAKEGVDIRSRLSTGELLRGGYGIGEGDGLCDSESKEKGLEILHVGGKQRELE